MSRPQLKRKRKNQPLSDIALRFRQQPAESKFLLAALIILVMIAIFAVHRPALSAKALSFDDDQYMTGNYLVQNPGWNSAKRFLCEILAPSTVQGYYQPLAMISLMLDYSAGGRADNLMPFHRTSLILHALNTALLIFLIYLLFGQPIIAAAVGLLFGLHPMTVEPIAWVGERKTLLAAFFALFALISYIRYTFDKNRKFYFLTLLLYILALMSKPTSTPIPALFLVLDYWPLQRLSKKTVWEKIPFFAVGFASAIITTISQGQTATAIMPADSSLWQTFAVFCHNVIFYPYKILFPINLSSHYPLPEKLPFSMILFGVGGTLILIPLLLLSLRRTRTIFAGWLFFIIAIFPTMGVIGFTNVIASDKFAYLPSVGLLLTLSYFLTKVTKYRAAIVVCAIALAGLEAKATQNYLSCWKDSQTLLRHMLALAPNAPTLHNGLGLLLYKEGKIDDALQEYYKALAINPNEAETHNNLGIALAAKGKTAEAAEHYKKADKLRSNYFMIHNNLGNAFAQAGKLDDAIAEYRKALEIKPLYPTAHYNLANVLAQKGRTQDAIKEYQAAIRLNPGYADAYSNLGNIFADTGRTAEAIDSYRKAAAADPLFAKAHYNLASILASQGKTAEAIAEYRQAVKIKPDYFDALNNLAVILAQQKKYDEAINYFNESLKINPLDIDTQMNLAITFLSAGKTNEAAECYRTILKLNPNNQQVQKRLNDLSSDLKK